MEERNREQLAKLGLHTEGADHWVGTYSLIREAARAIRLATVQSMVRGIAQYEWLRVSMLEVA